MPASYLLLEFCTQRDAGSLLKTASNFNKKFKGTTQSTVQMLGAVMEAEADESTESYQMDEICE